RCCRPRPAGGGGAGGRGAAPVAALRAHAPGAVAGYLAMARTTADRALAHGLLKPELAEDLLGVLAGGDTPGNATGGAAGGTR
ncbi:hypothetical protein ACFXP3_24780, partial [Streptomyces sp. NPDC059096]